MLYHVYKLHLSDADTTIINTKGWDGSPEGQAYSRLSFAKADNPEMPMHVMCAALLGLYQHGLTVEAPSIDKVFDYDNGAPASVVGDVHPVYHCRGLRSMSVGDVIVSKDGVSVCCSFGWASLPKHAAAAFAVMAKKIACQRPNALPEKDEAEDAALYAHACGDENCACRSSLMWPDNIRHGCSVA